MAGELDPFSSGVIRTELFASGNNNSVASGKTLEGQSRNFEAPPEAPFHIKNVHR